MKLGVPFLQFPLQFDAAVLAAEVQAIEESAWRPHPAGYAGNDALLLITRDGDPTSDAIAGPMQPTEYLNRCPYLMQVLENIGATWGRDALDAALGSGGSHARTSTSTITGANARACTFRS